MTYLRDFNMAAFWAGLTAFVWYAFGALPLHLEVAGRLGLSPSEASAMAKTEIAIAIAEAELGQQKDDVVTKRLLFTFAAALVTIGFWGTAVSLHKVAYLAGAVVVGLAGLILMGVAGEWRFRKWRLNRQANKRRKSLARVEDLNRRIKRLEHDLEKEEKKLKKKVKEAAKAAKMAARG